jgi:PAS domain S-box-containing protein
VELGENTGQLSIRMLLNQSSDAVEIVDPETLTFVDVNERACTDLGYSREEMLSLRIFDVDPTVTDDVRITVEQQLQLSQCFVREGIHRRKDGSTFPVEVSFKLVRFDRNYCIAIVRDTTRHKHAEQAIQNDTRIRFPEWEGHYRAAVLERDINKLFKLVEVAEAAVLTRLEALPLATHDLDERHELMEAWSRLQTIKRVKLNFLE